MLDKILRFLHLRTAEEIERKAAEDAFEQEFHDLPDPRERVRMSPERLAILLSQQQAGTPAYILVEHELTLRIASVQTKATLQSGWLGLIGTLLGAALGFFLGTLSPKVEQIPKEQVCRCECGSQVQGPTSLPKPPGPSSDVPSTKNVAVKPGCSKSQAEKTDGR